MRGGGGGGRGELIQEMRTEKQTEKWTKFKIETETNENSDEQ